MTLREVITSAGMDIIPTMNALTNAGTISDLAVTPEDVAGESDKNRAVLQVMRWHEQRNADHAEP